MFIFKKRYQRRRVALIGIPHFNWKLINLMIKEGKLKNINRLIKSGSYGEVVPQQDLCSAPVEFTSIITGVKKEKHSIGYGKGTDMEYVKDGRIITRLDIKAKTIWEIAEAKGKKVGIYNWLLLWPPGKVNGFMVTGRLSQDENRTYPKELQDSLNKKHLEHEMFDSETALKLIKDFDVDLFIGMDEWLHGPTHMLWENIEPCKGSVRDEKEMAKGKEELFGLYERIDPFFGELQKEFPEITIIIVGDSGIRPADSPTYCTGREIIDLFKILELGIQLYAYDIYPPSLPKAKPTLYIPKKNQHEKQKIIDVLGKIKLKQTGSSFIQDIQWQGDNLSFSFNFHPSFVNYRSGFLPLILPDGSNLQLWITKLTGVAVPKGGAFIAKGPMIKQNYDIDKVDILDVAPTVLHLLDIPIPQEMDGKVLNKMLTG